MRTHLVDTTAASASKQGSDITEESDLIELPTTQASKATFPPGCCVWILPAISCQSHGDGCDVPELVMSDGKVLSVFLGDVFSSSSKIYYKLAVAGGCGTLLVEEARLVFANNMPVLFLPTTEKAYVLMSVCSRKNGLDGVYVFYSLMISSKGNDFTVKHSVLPGQIRFRLDCLAASVPVDQSHIYEAQHTSLQRNSNATHASLQLVNSKAKSPPPGFGQLNETGDGSFVMVVPKRKHKTQRIQKELRIPSWLVANDSSRCQVIVRRRYTFCHV
jgi:hypothetical protein